MQRTAIDFVRAHGNPAEQARLQYLLTLESPSPEAAGLLLAGQKLDGGWSPFWAPGYSSLDATCFKLAQAEQLGLFKATGVIARAIDFIAARQGSDGSWEEDEQPASMAPPWAKPGDMAARLYLTANCGFWLAQSGQPGRGASRAADYIGQSLQSDGRLPSYLHTHWLAGGLWFKLERADLAERVFGYLGRSFDELSPSNLAWLVVALRISGVQADRTLIQRALERLERTQQPDGRWASDDGAEWDVHSTLEVLWAFQLCGRLDTSRS